MCASYGIAAADDFDGFDERIATDDLVAWLQRFAPGSFGTTRRDGTPLSPMISAEGFEAAWWWLWVRGVPARATAFNARSERLLDSPLWRTPFRERRVLLPASHYFERANQPGVTGRFRFHHPGLGLFAIAGIAAPTGLEVGPASSFAMVTRPPAAPGAAIHDRMPLLVPRELQWLWLDPGTRVDRAFVDLMVAGSAAMSDGLVVAPAEERPRY